MNKSFFPVIKMQCHDRWFRARNNHIVLGLNRNTSDFLLNIVKFQPSSKLHIFITEENDKADLIPTVHTLLATTPIRKIIIHISPYMPKSTKKLLLDCFRDALTDDLYKHRLKIMNEKYTTYRFHINDGGSWLEISIGRYGNSAKLISFKSHDIYLTLSYFYLKHIETTPPNSEE